MPKPHPGHTIILSLHNTYLPMILITSGIVAGTIQILFTARHEPVPTKAVRGLLITIGILAILWVILAVAIRHWKPFRYLRRGKSGDGGDEEKGIAGGGGGGEGSVGGISRDGEGGGGGTRPFWGSPGSGPPPEGTWNASGSPIPVSRAAATLPGDVLPFHPSPLGHAHFGLPPGSLAERLGGQGRGGTGRWEDRHYVGATVGRDERRLHEDWTEGGWERQRERGRGVGPRWDGWNSEERGRTGGGYGGLGGPLQVNMLRISVEEFACMCRECLGSMGLGAAIPLPGTCKGGKERVNVVPWGEECLRMSKGKIRRDGSWCGGGCSRDGVCDGRKLAGEFREQSKEHVKTATWAGAEEFTRLVYLVAKALSPMLAPEGGDTGAGDAATHQDIGVSKTPTGPEKPSVKTQRQRPGLLKTSRHYSPLPTELTLLRTKDLTSRREVANAMVMPASPPRSAPVSEDYDSEKCV